MLIEVDPGVRVRLGKDRATGKSRGFAFAEFGDPARAAEAIRRFDAFEMRGRRLRVNDADDKPPTRAPRPFVPTAAAQPYDPTSFAMPNGSTDDRARRPFGRKGGSRRGLRARKRSLR